MSNYKEELENFIKEFMCSITDDFKIEKVIVSVIESSDVNKIRYYISSNFDDYDIMGLIQSLLKNIDSSVKNEIIKETFEELIKGVTNEKLKTKEQLELDSLCKSVVFKS